ncbi:MAG: TonB-dependent receptor [Acidobacteria bacterium]|nr:TonB-dependent receptor [Acidobacteriota bacterium]
MPSGLFLRTSLGACLALFLLLTVPALAQVNATLSGTASDTSGALIPGVEVTATNLNTGIITTAITNETGSYTMPSLQPGVYRLTAALAGFQTASYNNVQLSQGQQVRLNFSLQVGTVAQAVEVVSEADTRLATTSVSVGDALPEVEVRSLPLATRDVLDLVKTTPGAVGDNFAGARVSQLNTTLDGLVVSDGRYLDWNGAFSATFASPDLVEEVQVMVNTVDAAVGRGSGQVQMQTRSGGNEFHGALFYADENSALKAKGWFQNLVGADKSFQNRHQFGGRIGGPIKRNKAFFFVLYDGQRYLEKQNVVSTVLTAPAREGIFRYLTENALGASGGASRRNGNAFSTTPSVNLAGNILTANPTTGAPLFVNSFSLFGDVRDPNRTRIDPVWVTPQLLRRMPLPNDWTAGDGLNTAGFRWLRRHPGSDSATGSSPDTNRDTFSIRFDYQINDKNKANFRMSREEDWGVTGQSGLPAFPDGFFGEARRFPGTYNAAWISTISPTVLNELRWGLRISNSTRWSPFHMRCCYRGKAESDIIKSSADAVASFPQAEGHLFYMSPTAGLGTYAPLGTATPNSVTGPLWQFTNTLSWTKGSHSFQSGVDVQLTNSDQSNGGGTYTTLPFATLGVGNIPVSGVNSTNFRGLNSNDVGTAQDILANLAGTIANIRHQFFVNSPKQTTFSDFRETISFARDFHQNDWAVFFKDNWKVTTNFTVNLGVRYDKYGTPYDASGLGVRPKGGQSALVGISGKDFSALWNPGASAGSTTLIEFAGKHSPNPAALIYNNDWNNIAPSVGFSWSLPWFRSATVLRGGYGITYTGGVTYLQYSSNIASAPGTALAQLFTPATYLDISRVTAQDARFVPLDTGGARPFDPVPLTNRTAPINGYADNREIPYVQGFNLSIQRELARNLTVDISYVGSKGTKLWGPIELNEPNIFENELLSAFNVTRAGGNAPLFDRILNGLNVTGVGTVNGTTLTGSQALRRFTTTNQWIANGEVASLANWFNTTSALTGRNGGLLRNGRLPENFIVVNPQFGNVRLHGNIDSSIYHSMTAQLTQRLSHGASGRFSYTWSKNLGNSAAGNAQSGDTTANTRDPRNRQFQRGLVIFNRAHQFKAHGTWNLPFGPNEAFLAGAPGWVGRLVEGWDLSGIFSWTSGAPLTFTSTRRTLGFNANSNTADLAGNLQGAVGKVRTRDGFVEYFENLRTQRGPLPNYGGDTTLPGRFTNQVVVDGSGNIVLQNPQPGTTGNTSLNLGWLEGPRSLGLDMALSKKIRIGEMRTFTIRADAINILNTPQWGNPNTDINAANFGRITTASGERTFTINARVDF